MLPNLSALFHKLNALCSDNKETCNAQLSALCSDNKRLKTCNAQLSALCCALIEHTCHHQTYLVRKALCKHLTELSSTAQQF